MQAIIRYPDDRRIEVVVASVGRHSMRVVPRQDEDAMQLSLSYGQWTDECGTPVEFESLVVDGANDVHGVLEAQAAGASW